MAPSTADWDQPLDLYGRKHTHIITDVPAMWCECGEITHNLDLLIRVEELVDRLVLDALEKEGQNKRLMTR